MEEVTCYEYGKQGHIKPDYPKYLKRKKGDKEKKKDLKATWSDASSSLNNESEREEEANLYLILLRNEVEELRNSISKLHKGKESLDTLVMSQRPPLVRHGLGFQGALSSSSHKIIFVKATQPQAFEKNSNEVSNSNTHTRPPILKKGKGTHILKAKPRGTKHAFRCVLNPQAQIFGILIMDVQGIMTGDKSLFVNVKDYKGGKASFGNDAKDNVIDIGSIGKMDNLGKFDAKTDIGIFLGYSTSSKAYRVFNKCTLVVEESMNVVFNGSNKLDYRKGVFVNGLVGASEELKVNVDDPS
ncbi:uncharacterized protein LOC125370272 [Ricinus communis]|uniref:uncharacterized protein LOC125370272 n=1 Tax=Ricinus communis TaxID=3988 RepID=UPI00201A3A55|nr:uncharacterized protein LOC125370272 [Ricinus communis]